MAGARCTGSTRGLWGSDAVAAQHAEGLALALTHHPTRASASGAAGADGGASGGHEVDGASGANLGPFLGGKVACLAGRRSGGGEKWALPAFRARTA